MSTARDESRHSESALAVAGAHEWLALCDELLAGLVHALNNRVTAVGVCAELLDIGDAQMARDGLLTTEVANLHRTAALLALLPARVGAPEALEIGPVLDDAIALHGHHPRLRGVGCAIEHHAALQPVRAPRWMLLRLLLLVVHAAATSATEERREKATIHLNGDDAQVTVRASTRGDAGPYAIHLAQRCGAAFAREGGDLLLSFPSLTALRRDGREGSSRTTS